MHTTEDARILTVARTLKFARSVCGGDITI